MPLESPRGAGLDGSSGLPWSEDMACTRRRPGLLLSGILLLSALAAISQAQMTLDGSLGPGGREVPQRHVSQAR